VAFRSSGSGRWSSTGSLSEPVPIGGEPRAELASSETVNFAHSLGETVTAAIEAGLRIDSLTEHLEASKPPRPPLVPRESDGRYRLRLDGQLLPVLFTLLATKPNE
jgi:hypothetical protein